MNYRQAYKYLTTFINYENRLSHVEKADFTLGPIKALLNCLGDPQERFISVHIAGSKGKGSTAVFIASILNKAGLKTGLYTSPHLYDLRERIRVLSSGKASFKESPDFAGKISEKEFAKVLTAIRPHIDALQKKTTLRKLTYFEILTAAAFFYFASKRIDVAVLETGLGGRLDATNVVESMISVITPIELEHAKILGNTLRKIAKEKSAIIKGSNKAVIVGRQEKEALDVILNECRVKKVEPVLLGKHFDGLIKSQDFKSVRFDFRGKEIFNNVEIKLPGLHQADNAALAIGCVLGLKKQKVCVSRKDIYQGLKEARWPLRFEVVEARKKIIFDSAHTPQAFKALLKSVRELFPREKIILILGISADKNLKAIAEEVVCHVEKVFIAKAKSSRALDINLNAAKKLFKGKEVCKPRTLKIALNLSLNSSADNEIILVAGSIFLAAEARNIIRREYHV
ncbi:MAG: bifunctional folylpolyglutamate synthase/dihydrofolate synthase [Candidatus Omnitrophica bacterium]|nr:bifunctional folylpolyglutamate synthase/dihydrofolate synthase [Candidatus Omnitrophota bacterium]